MKNRYLTCKYFYAQLKITVESTKASPYILMYLAIHESNTSSSRMAIALSVVIIPPKYQDELPRDTEET